MERTAPGTFFSGPDDGSYSAICPFCGTRCEWGYNMVDDTDEPDARLVPEYTVRAACPHLDTDQTPGADGRFYFVDGDEIHKRGNR
jgi:hypothetical protein